MIFKRENHMNVEQIEPISTLKEHTNSIDAIKINPASKKTFVTGSHDKTIKIWDLSTCKCLTTSQADRYFYLV